MQLHSLIRICFGVAASLAAAGAAYGQAPKPVVGTAPPIWDGNGTPPASASQRRVFLSPLRDTVVILSPSGSNYVKGGGNTLERVPLHNRLDPIVSAAVDVAPDGGFLYQYIVRNGPKARDNIGDFTMVLPVGDDSIDVRSFDGWGGTGSLQLPLVAIQRALPGEPGGCIPGWRALDDEHEIKPGAALQGFAARSELTPGFTTALFDSREYLGITSVELFDEV